MLGSPLPTDAPPHATLVFQPDETWRTLFLRQPEKPISFFSLFPVGEPTAPTLFRLNQPQQHSGSPDMRKTLLVALLVTFGLGIAGSVSADNVPFPTPPKFTDNVPFPTPPKLTDNVPFPTPPK
jgi:hypothetical protein